MMRFFGAILAILGLMLVVASSGTYDDPLWRFLGIGLLCGGIIWVLVTLDLSGSRSSRKP